MFLREATVDEIMRKEICRLVAGLVVADDDLTPKEEAFLDRVLARFEIPAAEREVIFPIIDRTEAAEAIRKLPEPAQRTALSLLLEATVADGVVAPEERAYLGAVARELGISEAELDGKLAAQMRG
jgi:uncharacterized tellurite resistance protein B-like protein